MELGKLLEDEKPAKLFSSILDDGSPRADGWHQDGGGE